MSMSTSSTSSTSSVASFYTSNGVTRLNGSELISGLDTESLITALTSKTQSKIDKQGQLEQKAQWKQEMYQEIESLMVSFNSNYFSYSSTSSNIMSSKFFDSGELTSSSSAVSATGESSDAGNVVINSILNTATAASLTGSDAVSDKNITSGAIRTAWTPSDLSGKSLTVTYGGSDYTLTLDSSASLDSDGNTQDNLQSIADALNSKIDANSSLSGKLQFSVESDGTGGYAMKLSTTSSTSTASIRISANSSDSTSSDFLTAIGFTSGSSSTDGSISGSSVTLDSSSVADSSLFSHTVSSSSNLALSIGTTSYAVTLGKDMDLSSLSIEDVVSQLQSQIDANTDLKSAGVTITASGDGYSVTGATVTGGSQNLLTGLGLDGSGSADKTALSETFLGDTLAGSTLTVQLNGVSKTISFQSTDESSYSTASGLESYLQDALDNAYGSGKVTVGLTGADGDTDRELTFTTSDTTSIFKLSSSSTSNVLNENGALRIAANETNRLETTKTLNQLKSELNNTLTEGTDGKYTISVNGKDFSFTGNTELGTVLSTINSDTDAGVNISYSQTLNQFRITADDTGAQGKIDIEDVSGNLAESLFGTASSQTFTSGTDLDMWATLGGTEQEIKRSTNSFTLDGVTLNVADTFNTSKSSDDEITFTASSDVDDLYQKISDFVDAYNTIIDKVNTYTTETPYGLSSSSNGSTEQYEPLTDSQKEEMTDDEISEWNEKAKQGLLENDQTLNSILSDLREAMERTVSASGLSLSSIGISTTAYDTTSGGKLEIDETTLKSALQTESDKVEALFTDTDGISAKVKDVLTNYVGESGNSGVLYNIAGSSSSTVASDDQLDKQITQYKENITNLKTQLTDEQDYWQTKFTTMESKLSVLNSQYTYLTSMLDTSSS